MVSADCIPALFIPQNKGINGTFIKARNIFKTGIARLEPVLRDFLRCVFCSAKIGRGKYISKVINFAPVSLHLVASITFAYVGIFPRFLNKNSLILCTLIFTVFSLETLTN